MRRLNQPPLVSTDPYQTLGISPNATLTEARDAYLKHVRVLHPDRFDPVTQKVEWELANQMLLDLNAAWEAIESGSASVSHQETHPTPPGPPPRGPKPPPPSPKPPAPFSSPKSEASFVSGKPITFSRAIGEVGPYSDQAMASLVLILLGVFLFFSGFAFLFFIPGILLAHTAKASIRKHDYRGRWMAVLSLWAGYLGLFSVGVFYLLPSNPSAAPPALAGANNQAELLNDELARLDKNQEQEIASAENNLDGSLALLKLQTEALRAKIAAQTKALADLKQNQALLKNEADGLSGERAAVAASAGQQSTALQNWDEVNGGKLQKLQKNAAGMAAQIAAIESELKNNTSTLDQQVAFLGKPRDEQVARMDSQITARYDEQRRMVKEKLAQLDQVKKGNP